MKRDLSVTLRDVATTLLRPADAGRPRTEGDGSLDAGRRPSHGRPRRGRPALDALLLSASIAVVAALVKVVWPRFTWFGDNAESFFPLWHVVGSALREGRWPGFDPTAFAGGNVVGEANYGLFNPVTLANAVLVSGFDELARASFVVTAEFLVLLGLAVRSLAVAYWAHRAAAFTAGMVVPFCGFTLYWGAGNWICGLMSITWVTWTWWAARRYSSGAGGPLAIVVFGGLAVTVGYPYALLGVLVVLAGLSIELLSARRFPRLGGLVLAGLCVGGITLLVYLPLVAALPVGDRMHSAAISNSSYLAPSLGDLIGLSSPTLLPEINAWGRPSDVVPSVYLSWLVLPLLPWLRWRNSGDWRARLGLLVPTGAFLLMTLGPDRIWMFRWPLRLVEYSWVGACVCFALVLSKGLARDHAPSRAVISAAIVGGGFFLAWASTPLDGTRHLLWTAAVGSLVALTVTAVRRHGLRMLAVMAVLGTVIVTPAQAATAGWDHHPVVPDLDIGRVSDLATVRSAGETYRGTVYQMADVGLLGPEATRGGYLTFGNMAAAAGHQSINRYTGIAYATFMQNMSLNYRGSVRDDWPVATLYEDVPGYDTPIIDALGIDTLVLATRGNEPEDRRPQAGWRTVLRDEHRTVLQRRVVSADGPDVTPSTGVEVVAAADAGTGARLTVRSDDGGTVLLDRLAWPGYSAATAAGDVVDVREGPLGLVELAVPAGEHVIDLEYRVPGLRAGAAAVILGGLVALAHQLVWWRGRRRGGDPLDGIARPAALFRRG
jgi:hypothetical protein